LLSLSVFQFAAAPLLRGVFRMDNQQYQDFIEERKRFLPEFVFAALRS
jgi:hypothetical protein